LRPVSTTAATAARSRLYLILLAVLWLAIYLPGLFHPALLDDADTVHSEAVREMLIRQDWVTLHADGIRYLEKAPLQYWAVAVCYKIFGISDWSTRLPLSLAALLLAFALFGLGRRVYDETAGFYAALIVLTAFGPYLFTRFFIPDLIVGLWLTLGFWLFLYGLEQETPSRWVCWGLAITAALNVLTKGLIGVVFPIAILGIYLLLTRNLKYLWRMRLVSSSLIFLAVAAPWHILAGIRNPAAGEAKGFFWFYFVNEHIKRYLGTRYPKDYDTVPFLLFWGLILVWLLPWSAFLPQGIRQVPGHLRDYASNLSAAQRASLLFGVWAATILVFFSFSTRQEYYVVPALPALALLMGSWLSAEASPAVDEGLLRSGRISSQVLLAVGVLIFLAATGLAALSKPPAPGIDIAELLRHDPSKYALSMGHIFDLTPQALGAFRTPLLGTGAAFLLGTLLNLILRRRKRFLAANLALATMMVGVIYCAHLGFMVFEPVMSSKGLALAVEKIYKPGDVIVINGEYEEGSTLNYYLRVPVRMLNHVNANLWFGSLFPDAPHVFETDESFQKLWSSPSRVFLWSEADDVPTQLFHAPAYEIARRGGKVILSNQPSALSGQ
jgi:4-amino-4-deoxy-L-arabinose transferase-like glycosyltransferase